MHSFAQDPADIARPPYEFQEFPKARHHRDGKQFIVRSPEEEERLTSGPNWKDKPWTEQDLAEPASRALPPQPPADCPNCLALRAQFDSAWGKLTAEHDSLKAAHAELQEAHDRLGDENQSLTQELAALKTGQPQEPSTAESIGNKRTRK